MTIRHHTAAWAIAYGLFIWLEATLIIRWAGDLVFVPESTIWTVSVFVLTAPLVYAIGWFFFATFQTPPGARAAAAVLICAAGLIADAMVVLWIDNVFPTMTEAQARLFAGWVPWAYGLGLLSGVWPSRLIRVPEN
ncbi:MAG: DUF5367 family protein [Alphaproteobacteria bacterium]|nr:DUF5367 family protein [Alphaproteobacteria bacterium]